MRRLVFIALLLPWERRIVFLFGEPVSTLQSDMGKTTAPGFMVLWWLQGDRQPALLGMWPLPLDLIPSHRAAGEPRWA